MAKDHSIAGHAISRAFGTLTATWLALITLQLSLAAGLTGTGEDGQRLDPLGGGVENLVFPGLYSTYHPVRDLIASESLFTANRGNKTVAIEAHGVNNRVAEHIAFGVRS